MGSSLGASRGDEGSLQKSEEYVSLVRQLEASVRRYQERTAIRGVVEPSERYAGPTVAPYMDDRRTDDAHLRAYVIEALDIETAFSCEAKKVISELSEQRKDIVGERKKAQIFSAVSSIAAFLSIVGLIAL